MAAGFLAAIQLATQVANSQNQKRKAKEFEKTQRPVQPITPAAQEYLNKAKFEASRTGLPGQAQMESQLDRSSAETRRAIKDSGLSPFAMMAGFGQTEDLVNGRRENLDIQGEQSRKQAQAQYYAALNGMSTEQQRQFEFNKKDPYLSDMAASSAYRNASMRNQESAINTGLGNAMNLYLASKLNGDGGGSERAFPTGVNPNYVAPSANGQVPQTAQIPELLNYSNRNTVSYSGANDFAGPLRHNPSTLDMGALKSQYEITYGPMTDEQFIQYFNLSQGNY